MTKREMAERIAEHMNTINQDVDIERMTKVLASKMTSRELESCLLGYQNEGTGEFTYNHKEAVGWFNEGENVSLWTEGKRRTTWVH